MEEQEQVIDLREILEIIIENKNLVIKMTSAFVILAVLYLLIASPVYESEAMLRIKKQQGLSSSLLDMATGGNMGMSQQQMGTYAEILKSRGVVIPVIEATEEKEDDKYPDYTKYVEKRIVTTPVPNTDILMVKVSNKDPELAQKANRLLVTGFLKRITNLTRIEQTTTKEFLVERANAAKNELDIAETSLQEYKAEHKIISPTESAKIFTDRISETEKMAAINQVNLEAAQARLAVINRQLGGSGIANADNRTIQQYNMELAKLEAEKIDYQTKYTGKHPMMVDITSRITNLRAKIQDEIARVAALEAPSDNPVHQGLVAGKYQSESEASVARQKAVALQQIIDQNNADLEKLPSIEKGYVKLACDAQVANEIYIMLAKRLEEAKVAEVMQPNDVQVIDDPTLPEKTVRPRKGLILSLSFLLGLMSSCGFVVLNTILNRTIRTEEDVKLYLNLPVLGVIPEEESLAEAMDKEMKKGEGFFHKIKEFIWKQ